MKDYDSRLGIYSTDGGLFRRLSIKLTNNYIQVKKINNLDLKNLSSFNYLLISFLDNTDTLDDFIKICDKIESKILVLIPLYVDEKIKYVLDSKIKSLRESNPNLGVLLVPELLGPEVTYKDSYISHNLIRQIIISDRPKVPNSSILINSISVNKLCEIITKEIFSFGISGEVISVLGPKHSSRFILSKYLSINSDNIIEIDPTKKLAELDSSASIKADFSLRLAIKATKSCFEKDFKMNEVLTPEIKKQEYRQNNRAVSNARNIFYKVFKMFLYSLLLLLLPSVSLLISAFLLLISTNLVLSKPDIANNLIDFSLKSINITRKVSFGIPFYHNYSNILYKVAYLSGEGIKIVSLAGELGTKIVSDSVYDLSSYTDSLSAILDRIHTDSSFLESDLNELNGYLGEYVKRQMIIRKIDIVNYKRRIYEVKLFVSRLGYLLGEEKPMKYLILFQNNMEIRPTGGFIGSFALVTFDKGRLAEMVVNDVYSADGQLKGHVEPPAPIKNHLGEGGWYMRDANWDPNFPDSARKIEWFLDKEINTQVDGVVAIDLYFIEKMLEVTGPINLSDFNKTITSDNLYLSTQEEVESNFFPGSIKKASFITSLSRQLLLDLQSLDKSKYVSLTRSMYQALEEKHIQVYFHDINSQNSISLLGYSGEINLNTNCGLRCYYVKYSLVDANLGVNKSNLYIKRNHNLKTLMSKTGVTNELSVNYTNSANQSLGNQAVYKSYTRILLPLESEVVAVRQYLSSGKYEDISYDVENNGKLNSVGFLVNVLPGNTSQIQVVWNQPSEALYNGGELKVLAIKQSGTDSDAFSFNFVSPEFSLTRGTPSVYTTNLAKDFYLNLYLKPND